MEPPSESPPSILFGFVLLDKMDRYDYVIVVSRPGHILGGPRRLKINEKRPGCSRFVRYGGAMTMIGISVVAAMMFLR